MSAEPHGSVLPAGAGRTRYTFAEHTVLTSEEQCKKGGWATSIMPVFKNQGDCVSFFAAGK
jgi:hypothetical protein